MSERSYHGATSRSRPQAERPSVKCSSLWTMLCFVHDTRHVSGVETSTTSTYQHISFLACLVLWSNLWTLVYKSTCRSPTVLSQSASSEQSFHDASAHSSMSENTTLKCWIYCFTNDGNDLFNDEIKIKMLNVLIVTNVLQIIKMIDLIMKSTLKRWIYCFTNIL